MKLFIDIGNSRLKWATWDGAWQAEGSVPVGSDPAADWLDSLPQPEGIWIAAVSAEGDLAAVTAACRRTFDITPVRLRTQARACGVRCAYRDPARLGVDRWLAVIAGFRETGGPAIVFDCGTAITADAVTAEGEHLGGLIMPGVDLMRRALYGNTAGIPDEGEVAAADMLARDTRAAVSGGSLQGAAGFLQRVASEVRHRLGAATPILLTGGDAPRLRPLLDGDFAWRPRLVLDGMRAAAECAGESE